MVVVGVLAEVLVRLPQQTYIVMVRPSCVASFCMLEISHRYVLIIIFALPCWLYLSVRWWLVLTFSWWLRSNPHFQAHLGEKSKEQGWQLQLLGHHRQVLCPYLQSAWKYLAWARSWMAQKRWVGSVMKAKGG